MTLSLPSPVHGRRAVLLVAVVLLSAGKAEADCGGHVAVPYPTIRTTLHTAPMPATAPATTDPVALPLPEPPEPVKRPCHGPNCTGSPVREFPPTAPVVPAGSPAKELVRYLGFDLAGGTDAGPGFDRDTTSPRPVHRADTIFHPPRHG